MIRLPLMLFSMLVACLALVPLPGMAQDGGDDPAGFDEPAKPRPDEDEVRRAERVVKKLDPDEIARFNAMRFLARREEDAILLPSWRVAQGLPPLGVTTREEEQALSVGEMLRLTALLRGGYPANDALKRELDDLFESEQEFLPIDETMLNLLVLDALQSREDETLASYRERGLKRAEFLADDYPWTEKAPDLDIYTLVTLRELVWEAIARGLIARRGWAELPNDWALVLKEVWSRISDAGELWEPLHGWASNANGFVVDVYARARRLSLIAMIDSLARREGSLTVNEEDYAESFADKRQALAANMQDLAGVDLKQRLTKQLKKDQKTITMVGGDEVTGYLISSASVAFAANLAEEYLPDDALPKDRSLLPAALMLNEKPWAAPADWDLDLTWLLGWKTTRSHSTSAALAGGTATPRPHPVLAALSLIGVSGGFVVDEDVADPFEPIEAEDWSEITDALTTLEQAEVPRTFEERVDFAIDSSATWLLEHQNRDGSFPGRYRETLGGHALVVLALLDAGVDRERKEIRGAMKYLRDLKAAGHQTYSYGIALMALQKYYEPEQEEAGMLEADDQESHEKAARKLQGEFERGDAEWIQEMTDTLADDFEGMGWGYRDAKAASHRDNSNSQYAVLGLKAASLLGVDFDRDVLLQEAQRWLDEFVEDSSMDEIEVPEEHEEVEEGEDGRTKGTSRAILGTTQPGGWAYTCGPDQTAATLSMTAAGLSSVAICRDELALYGLLTDEMKRDMALRVAGAHQWLGKKFTYSSSASLNDNPPRSPGFGTLYNLYAVERGCVLTNAVLIAEKDWYVEGALFLLNALTDAGEWPVLVDIDEPNVVDLCFAILFLKRAAIHIHRPKPKGPITGSDEE